MATVSGYSAVLLAATHLPRFLPMLTTAAGTIRPAQGLILGAGVAGLQAIATARRLGAVVEAFDVRPAVKEQVKSLGATFIEIPTTENLEDKGGYARQVSAETLAQQQKLLHERAKAADFIISTAQVPGKPAPRLITREMVADMKPGAVIIDLAAESGGNCELTQADQIVRHNGVADFGADQSAGQPAAGRQPDVRPQPGHLHPGNHQRKRVHPGLEERDFRPNLHHPQRGAQPPTKGTNDMDTLAMIYIFILAIFTGVEVISRVPTVLHTPLMSGANAIHGIVLIGGVIVLGMRRRQRASSASWASSPSSSARSTSSAASW